MIKTRSPALGQLNLGVGTGEKTHRSPGGERPNRPWLEARVFSGRLKEGSRLVLRKEIEYRVEDGSMVLKPRVWMRG